MRSTELSALGVSKNPFLSSYKEQMSKSERRKEALQSAIEASKPQKKSPLVKSMRVITRGDYSAIATQKLAGRALDKIAEFFGTSESVISPHVAKAIALYRVGKLKVDGGEVQSEARKEGKEDGEKVQAEISEALDAASEFLGNFSEATADADVASTPEVASSLDVLV